MIKIVIITHGNLGSEIYKTAESIVGKQEDVVIVTLSAHEGLQVLFKRVGELLENLGSSEEGVLVLTDMLGGTPCNAVLPYANSSLSIEIVSGINLYMLLSAFINRKNIKLKNLAEKVISDGQKSITNAKEVFLKKLK